MLALTPKYFHLEVFSYLHPEIAASFPVFFLLYFWLLLLAQGVV